MLHQPITRNSFLSIGFAILAFFLFSLGDAISKTLGQSYSINAILMMNGLTGIICCGGYILYKHGLKGFITPNLKQNLMRMVIIAMMSHTAVTSFKYIPLTEFYGIVFVGPLVVVALSHFVLGEKVGKHRLGATLAGFLGVMVIIGPQYNNLGLGGLLALATVLMGSLNVIVTRTMRHRDPIMLASFFPGLGIFITSAPFVFIFNDSLPSLTDLPLFEAYALSMMTAQIAITYAITRAHVVATISPYIYTQFIWGALFGYLFFDDLPGTWTLVGAPLVIISGIYVAYREWIAYKGRIEQLDY